MRWSGQFGSDAFEVTHVGLAGVIAVTMFGVAASRRRAAATYREIAAHRSGVERERLEAIAAEFTLSADRAEDFARTERALDEASAGRDAPRDEGDDGVSGQPRR